VLANLKDIEGIIQINPMVEGQALVTGRGTPRGVLVRGLPPETFGARPILSEKLVAGKAEDFRDTNVAIGRRLAEMLGVRVGDEVTLLSPESKTSVFGSIPRYRTYTVGAIFDVGMYEYDSGFVFMPLPAAQTFYQMPVSVTALEVFTTDPYNLAPVKQAIMQNPSTVRMVDWKEQNASFTNALEIERTAMFFILSLIIAVAAFNIFSSMYMQVKVKGRDIAILRTMGATRGAISRIFFMSGMLIGLIGTGLGVLGAWAFSRNIDAIKNWLESLTDTDLFAAQIYFLDHLPAQLNTHDVLQVVGISLLVSFIATLMPAWRAAKLDPVEALRYE
jgi:lipoprotein-releasing system permease protein